MNKNQAWNSGELPKEWLKQDRRNPTPGFLSYRNPDVGSRTLIWGLGAFLRGE